MDHGLHSARILRQSEEIQALSRVEVAAMRPALRYRTIALQIIGVVSSNVALAASANAFGEHGCKDPTQKTSCDAARFGIVFGILIALGTLLLMYEQFKHAKLVLSHRESVETDCRTLRMGIDLRSGGPVDV